MSVQDDWKICLNDQIKKKDKPGQSCDKLRHSQGKTEKQICLDELTNVGSITLCNKDSGAWDISTNSTSLRVTYN